ncbi:MAG: BamA/TamA family outer membrane protein [Bacteroidetes bacterium]|nr:BamA/TamA family outer membrane protein [Bacteroidota bacterium]
MYLFNNTYFLTRFLGFLVTAILISSCSTTKYLDSEESLYVGTNYKFENYKSRHAKREVKSIVSDLQPKANKKFLGLKMKLWIYLHSGDTTKKSKFNKFLRTKVGEAPILYEEEIKRRQSKIVETHLFNAGYFTTDVQASSETKNKKTEITLNVNLNPPYKIDSIFFPQGNYELYKIIRSAGEETGLNRGNIYNLENVRQEKERISEVLRNNGFYFFRSEYLIFDLDTNKGNNKLNIYVNVKPTTPYEALIVYRINDVYINTDYSINTDTVTLVPDTIKGEPLYYNEVDKSFRKIAIGRAIFIRKDEIYSRKNHKATLGQFMGMGTFKFVNVRFTEADSITKGFLNSYINLTKLPKRTVTLELEAVSKSNNYMGPGLRASARNRNTFRGAELLVFNLSGSFEQQIGKNNGGVNSFEFGPEVEITFPRFITPVYVRNPVGFYTPKTRVVVGYNYLKRTGFFNLTSLKLIYGFKWKENLLKDHELNLVNINYIRVSKKSDAFQQLLEDNFLLQKSFEEQFIAGITYRYVYNEQMIPEKKNQFYFMGSTDLSGNTISLIKRITTGKKVNSENPESLAGEVYAQFAAFDLEFRDYYNLNRYQKFVIRVFGGIGIAYGNSATLPYLKQYFSGGSSSIRAFRARSLGPGTYRDSIASSSFFDQGGDVRLEGNMEYRFRIGGMFFGALFYDAGNIWLLKDNPQLPGSRLSSTFLNELAMGTGIGLRFDANFFVLRLDLATPIRKPWLPKGNRYVLDKIKPGSSSWRSENLLLNIAIGYPF